MEWLVYRHWKAMGWRYHQARYLVWNQAVGMEVLGMGDGNGFGMTIVSDSIVGGGA